MATAPVLDLEQPTTDIVAIVNDNPVLVLTDAVKFDQFYERVKAECDQLVPDVTTERGRKEIASMAYKVARTKTAIDEAGKKLNEEARERINAVDESRRGIRERLDALKIEVRRPLTEWEDAEEARVGWCETAMVTIKAAAVVEMDATIESVQAALAQVEAITINAEEFQGYTEIAANLKASAIDTLTRAADRIRHEEEQRAELERLRAAEAERERIETEKREAEAAEARRAEAEKAEADRLAKLEQEAAERARREAEAAAETERKRVQGEHDAALAAERARAEEAERARKAETDRIAREEAARAEEAERARREQAAREADRAHRGSIMGEAKAALMEIASIDEAVAKTIVLAIVGGSIPHTRITF
jgi:colicin import membrane protein